MIGIRLANLTACFEGVIPSVLSTVAADGTPNISYLSHVVMADEAHVALSNQFFSKTKANLQANPRATLLLVDGRDGRQFRLALTFARTLLEGPLFEKIGGLLAASSAQVGLAGVMRLRSVDLFRVEAVAACPVPVATRPGAPAPVPDLPAIAAAVEAIADARELTAVVDATLTALQEACGFDHAVFLLGPDETGRLATVGSRGYDRSGVGSEIVLGEGLIGMAAARRHPVKVSDMSRIRRYGAAARASGEEEEDRLRIIALPGLADAMSQLAMPLVVHGEVQGVLFVESRRRLAFGPEAEAALAVVARQAAAAVLLAGTLVAETPAQAAQEGDGQPSPPPADAVAPRTFRVVHHAFDDSLFIDGAYVIKGVAGRLLMHMLEASLRDGCTDFTNRALRLSRSLRLPDFKDNLETRLLLLQRRLDERALPVRLLRPGQGRIRLVLEGVPVLETTGS